MLLSTFTPTILVHVCFALAALVLGPFALGARKGSPAHRMLGYAWVVLMLGAAISSAFILDFKLPNIGGYTPVHIVTVSTIVGLGLGIWHVSNGRIARHRLSMWITYVSGCVVAGLFALLPGRRLGQLLWHQALGLI